MSTKIYFILSFIPLLFIFTNAQLTLQDKNMIENFIYQSQSKTTGLFFEEKDALKHTKEAISVLNILGIQVKYNKEICKKLSENDKIDIESLKIDRLLNCKNNFKSYKPDFAKQKLVDLYHEGQLMNLLNISKWDELFKKTKNFMISENGKFSLYKIKEGKKKSILATALGIELMVLIAQNDEELKTEVMPFLQKSVDSLIQGNAVLNDDMIVYLEKGIPNYKLNYHVINALKSAKKVGVEISSLNNYLYRLLNYFNTFKYEMISNIDNTFYLINIYKLLEKVPLMLIHKESFNYLNEKNIKIQFENIFGDKIYIKDSTLNIKISENEEKNPKLSDKGAKKKSSYDLEDDDDNKSNIGETKKDIKITEKKNEVEFDLSKMIKGPGYFTLSINMKNKDYNLNEHIEKNIRSYSEVKIESVDFEIRDKIHEENNQRFPTLNNPNKITQNMKANQDCSLIARVKISSQGKKPTIMEQVFLRLRNKELNKSYNAYASKFDPDTNQYFIGFELDDPVNMESYNGAYEIYIVMSDPTIQNIITWEFGEIVISFTKPTDPLEEQKALKNKMEPKMEPTFSPEVKREKNMTIATVFSGFICILTILLIVVLVKSDSNIRNFPRSSFASLMNMLFVCILFIIAYILFLFWTKYNILQIMFCFVVISLPVCFIVYKALKNHQIEIVPDKDDDE
jgi:hypothetical protein